MSQNFLTRRVLFFSPGGREMGVFEGKGVYEAGEIKSTRYLQEAYEMGKGV